MLVRGGLWVLGCGCGCVCVDMRGWCSWVCGDGGWMGGEGGRVDEEGGWVWGKVVGWLEKGGRANQVKSYGGGTPHTQLYDR